jgi:hypothetical protein
MGKARSHNRKGKRVIMGKAKGHNGKGKRS